MIPVKVFRYGNKELVTLPVYKTEGSSGFDFSSIEQITIRPREAVKIKTGLFFEIPLGFEVQIRSRSGLAYEQGLVVLNQPSTIDSDYRGEILVLLYNTSKESQTIEKNDRIAQGILAAVERADFTEVMTLDELKITKRGDKGFGSTGRQ